MKLLKVKLFLKSMQIKDFDEENCYFVDVESSGKRDFPNITRQM